MRSLTMRSLRTLRWVAVLLVIMLLASLLTSAQAVLGTTFIRVTETGSTNPACGETWINACSLQTALAKAAPGDEIWVKAGRYIPGGNVGATFLVPVDVALYGGFAGEETDRSQRNWIAHPTILSGDIDGDDLDPGMDGIAASWKDIRGTNSRSVVSLDPDLGPISPLTVIDGFIITAGQGYPGSGLACQVNEMAGSTAHSMPTLNNLVFSGNAGSALWIETISYPTLNNATFVGNELAIVAAAYFGSSGLTGSNLTFRDNDGVIALHAHRGGPVVDLTNVTVSGTRGTAILGTVWQGGVALTLTGATFENNVGDIAFSDADYGTVTMEFVDATFINNEGPIFTGVASFTDPKAPSTDSPLADSILPEGRGAKFSVTNATFAGNHRAWGDGGILNCTSHHIGSACRAAFTNVRVTGNTTPGDGGAIRLHADGGGVSSVDLRNTTFSGNQAGGRGGAIASSADVGSTSQISATNSIFWGNSASTGNEISYIGAASAPALGSCLIEGWPNDEGAHVWGDRDPVFVAPATVPAPTTSGDYRLQLTSPAIDAGDNGGVPLGITTDLDGNPRFVDVVTVVDTGTGTPPIVDMGAYEHSGSTGPTPTPTTEPTPPPTTEPTPPPTTEPTPPPTTEPTPDPTLALHLSQAVSPAQALPGQAVTVTLTFTNTGEATASGVQLTLTLPTELTAAGGGSSAWDIGTVAPGETGTRTLVAYVSDTLTADAELQSTAALTGAAGDTAYADATLVVRVPRVRFATTTYTANEGDAAITVLLEPPNPYAAARVDYSCVDGSATGGVDYTPVSGTLYFVPGMATTAFSVPILPNGEIEDARSVQLHLDNPVGAALGTPVAATLLIASPGGSDTLTIQVFLPVLIQNTE